MPNARKIAEVFDQEFLPTRAKILEVAAALDRLDRASGSLAADSRRAGARRDPGFVATGGRPSGTSTIDLQPTVQGRLAGEVWSLGKSE